MMKKEKITVLITGAGAPGAPGIIKSLKIVKNRAIRIIGVDADDSFSIGKGLVDAFYKIPSAEDESFVKRLLEISILEKIDIIIPLVTKELFIFSKHKQFFEEHNIKVSVSTLNALNIANNKYELMKFCLQNKIPTPKFELVKSLSEFKIAAKNLGYPKCKICFKPPISNGLRGFRIVNDNNDKMKNLIYEKPNNVFIGYEEFIQIANDADFFPELLLMEYLPGEEFSIDALADNGRCLDVIPRTRSKIKMGISFAGTTINHKEIIEYSSLIIEKLGLNGNIGFQFKLNNQGIPCIIESNPRVQGTIILCTAAGKNLVYNAICANLKLPIEENSTQWNTKMIRYWDEIFFKDDGESFRL